MTQFASYRLHFRLDWTLATRMKGCFARRLWLVFRAPPAMNGKNVKFEMLFSSFTQSRSMASDDEDAGNVDADVYNGEFSYDNGDGNENLTNLHIHWAKTKALHVLHVHFSLLSISWPSSAKQQREIAKFEVLCKTTALEHKFSFFPPKLSALPTSVNFEELPHPCHIKKVEIVTKWLQ